MRTGREDIEGRMMTEAELTRARLAEQGRMVSGEAPQRAEHAKENVASGLHSAAERLRVQSTERGRPGLGQIADPLDRTASYLQTHSLSQIGNDARHMAQERPLVAAAGVFAAAFLFGRLLRRR